MPEEKGSFNIVRLLQHLNDEKSFVVKIAIAVALTLAVALMFPRGESIDLDYKVGSVWARKDLIAPFSFPIFREEREYAADVEQAKKKVFTVFDRDSQLVEQEIGKLNQFFTQLNVALRLRQQYRRSSRDQRPSVGDDSLKFVAAASGLEVPLSDREWDAIAALAAARGQLGAGTWLEELHRNLVHTVLDYYRVGILDKPKASLMLAEVAVRKGTLEEIVPTSHLYDRNDPLTLLEDELVRQFPSEKSAVEIGYKVGVLHISPNLKFDRAATDLAITAALETVPRTIGFVQENERVVSKHERITMDTKLKLESFLRARAERGPESDIVAQFIGTVFHVALVILLYGIYLYLFRKRIIGRNRLVALVALLLLMEGFFAYLTRELNVNVPIEYLILVPAASMLLTIIFDSRVGFYGTVVIAFLVAGVRGNDYSVALSSLVAGALSVYSVRDMKNRTQIFRSLGFIALGYALVIVALALERFESAGVVIEQLTFASVNAIISPVLTYGLLIFFERVFKVTTDLTLIELSHFNHPLLRLLAERAPGTYHHSLTIASLAEAGAVAVGANEILTRVGAYFHDIGKIEKPTYFVENQKTSRSRHDKLAPRMSSLIISAHVKDGVALAREYHLPEEVIDFIPQHHGTTLIGYFYSKALRLAQSSDDETKIDEIKDQDYQYPGPKPQSKETGILMMADAIEATTRTLEDPSPQKLEVAIDEVIKMRFAEGQLDECPLTLKDLTKIKAAFLNALVGIYHSRVKYPETGKPKVMKQDQPVPGSTPDERLARTIKEIDKQ